MEKPKVALFGSDASRLSEVYDESRRARIAEIADLHPRILSPADFEREAAAFAGIRALFTTWGMPALSPAQLALLPRLEAVFYAAGSVRAFAGGLLERGVRISSAWDANAVPVAEFALSQIILSCKGYFRNTREVRALQGPAARGAFSGPGCYGETVALLGAGRVARRLIDRLAGVELRVLLYDPTVDAAEAARLGVEKVELEEAFRRGFVVSNHVPNLPQTVGLIRAGHLRLMRPDATFINTGRGATVVEADLIAVLRERPDLCALLDVTWPEPPEAGSPLYTLPNVWLSSHIAGSKGDEVHRMADWMIDECRRWISDGSLKYEVTPQLLQSMA